MTDHKKLSDVDFEAFTKAVDAFGGEIDRWPSEVRTRFGGHDETAAFKPLLADAKALDAMLDEHHIPAMSAGLEDRLLADYSANTPKVAPAPSSSWRVVLGNIILPRFFAPVGGAAAIAIAGVFSGMTSAQDLAPEQEAYAYLADSDLYSVEDEEVF